MGADNAQDSKIGGLEGAAGSKQHNHNHEEQKIGNQDQISEAESQNTAASSKLPAQGSVSTAQVSNAIKENVNSELLPRAGIMSSQADLAGDQEASGDDQASVSQASQLHADHVEVFVNYD